MNPLFFVLISGVGIVILRIAFAKQIPQSMLPWNVFGYSDEELESQVRVKSFVIGTGATLGGIIGTYRTLTAEYGGAIHRFLAQHWGVFAVHHILGASLLMLGGWLLRVVFAKELPKNFRVSRLEDYSAQQIRRFVLGVLGGILGIVGAVIYYGIKPG